MQVQQVKVKFYGNMCSLADGTKHFDTWKSKDIFGVWSMAGAGRIVAEGKQVKREETLNQSH